jgi:cyclase
MIKARIIPILTFNGFALVKTINFTKPRMLGNPVQSARVFNGRGVDELVFIDIFATKQNRKINLSLVKKVIDECFMPVSIGGGISTLQDIHNLLKIGADKVIIKTHALKEPKFILEAAKIFGSQCVTVAIDAFNCDGQYFIQNELGLKIEVIDFVRLMQENGAGEFILTSVDNDGIMGGFDINLYNTISKYSTIPIVLSGGAGNPSHFQELFLNSDCNSVGAASIFSFTQYTPFDIKESIRSIGKSVRIID